ncbi:hypothetical protein [Phormidium pseudopriestleyi]|uniref:hypothetical protein n=1 Tax=Phormidium pseudopriestleyi TaxID=1759527 RepID=UPI001F5DB3A8|nr:hypothetical protein [Phormidium pseudopriestleyi]
MQEQKSLETLLDEAVTQYLQANLASNTLSVSPLPLTPSSVVYNHGSPKLGTEAEAILTAEIESSSGLLWRMIKYRRRIN